MLNQSIIYITCKSVLYISSGGEAVKLEQIEEVLEIASTGSISKAAENLYMKQPNLSMSIKNLEEELGFEIFKRTTRGIEITKLGRDFISFSQPIYNQVQSLKTICKDMQGQTQFNFGVSSQYFKFVTNVFISLYKKYKSNNIHMKLLEESFTDILENVLTQKSELGVLLMPSNQKKGFVHLFKSKRLEYVKLCECPPYAILGKFNPFYESNPPFLTVDMLKDYPYVTYFQDQNQIFALDNQLKIMGHYNRITVSDRGTLNEIISNTDAFFIASHMSTAYSYTDYYPGIKAIPLNDMGSSFEIGWIKNYGIQLSDIGNEFISMLEDVLNM